jgi:hypothetical protein
MSGNNYSGNFLRLAAISSRYFSRIRGHGGSVNPTEHPMTFSPQLDKTEASVHATVTASPLPTHPDTLLTSVELARTLKVNDRLPEVWRASGTGPVYMRAGGRRILYRWGDVLTWLNDRRFTSKAEEASTA